MSQVSNHPYKVPFERLVSESAHVLVVKNLGKRMVVFEATLPRETHHEKSGETHYQETAELVQVLRVLKSDTLAAGEEIKVWREPAYDFEAMKRYHTTGVLESPEVLTYAPVYPPDGNERILFLSGRSKSRDAWIQYLDAQEGLAAEKELRAALEAPPSVHRILPLPEDPA